MTLDEIKALALVVRKRIQKLVKGYRSMNDDTLFGACGLASYTLAEALKQAGVETEFVLGRFDVYDHCWLHFFPKNEPWLLDITATQFHNFAFEPVEARPLRETKGYEILITGEKALQRVNTWDEQAPQHHAKALARFLQGLQVAA